MSYSTERLLLGSQRESTVYTFRPWTLVLVPLVSILLQVYLPLFFQFLAYLELPLLVTVYFSLMRRSPVAGTLIGALIGIAQDSLSKNPLGLYGIVKTLVGYFAASVALRFDVDHGFIRALLGFFFFYFHQVVFWALSQGLLGLQTGFDAKRTAILGILNAAVAVSVFRFLDRLRERS
ncbi:MAG: rod shape-determining protein MreD [Bryobacterales bacterium]|nr:rod shape-determining protein MreD [Bryobacterales bacterium]